MTTPKPGKAAFFSTSGTASAIQTASRPTTGASSFNTITGDGSLFIIYDHERTKNGDILMARITEDDILAGRLVSPASRLKILIDHTKGVPEKQ